MIDTEKLEELGLSKSEIRVYICLLKLGEANVVKISQETGLHRTNIYDNLEKLKEKGLVSYLSKENKQFFRASDPENLLTYLKEKEKKVSEIVEELNKVKYSVEEKVSVEIFKGGKGMKSALKEILTKKEIVYGYNIAGQLREFLPEFSEYYFREQAKNEIKHKFIYVKCTKKPSAPYYAVKYLDTEFIGNTISLCFGDIILNLIWYPEMVAIKIKSSELAEDFKKHFDLLWKIAK